MAGKESISEAYKILVIKEKTTKISVKELCENIGISRTTFYKYFKDAYDIIEYIFVQDAMIPLDTLVSNKVKVRTLMENWYASFYENKEFYKTAIAENGQNSLFDTIISLLTEYNREVYKNHLSGEDLEYFSYKYAAIQAMLLKKWMLEGMKTQPEKMAEYFMRDLLCGQM